MAKSVLIIGSGFSSLSAAACLAQEGYDVRVFEKNNQIGGRARQFKAQGFTFDMGPSWYWMPDVFETFFERFGKQASDYYELIRLSPSYRVYFENNQTVDVPSSVAELKQMFEAFEEGSGKAIQKFLDEGQYKYEVGIKDLVYKPGQSLLEFVDWRVMKGIFKLDLFKSFHRYVRKYFQDDRILRILEFPILFLGAIPQNTPALYSLMNYADLELGTWYPMGGMHKIVEGMKAVCVEQGVEFFTGATVEKIETANHRVKQVIINGEIHEADVVISGADYHHVEANLLPEESRSYSESYWDKKVMAPSSLIFYLGINKKLEGLKHHNLFFDRDFGKHAHQIYQSPQWPDEPLFYVCAPSITDKSVAPEGHENLFLLMPVAPDLEDTEAIREQYFDLMIARLEEKLGTSIKDHIIYKRSYAHKDFTSDYHAYKGNAYGLANTLRQTAILKPSLRSKKVNNLFYTGQLTVPGPGVPPAIISGQVAASEIMKTFS
ncbi:MAG: phytoene desaturase family protein [Bacteroidota bacterium]